MATLDDLNALTVGSLPGLFGIQFTRLNGAAVTGQLEIRPEFMAPNGYLHAATVIALADTACGFGTIANLPEGAQGFTTIELKSNFLGTAREGIITCDANLAHSGRTTQIWDAEVKNEATGKTIALFRCTQMILYPR
jgi:uncharacterized protein (TIGR00369 family)